MGFKVVSMIFHDVGVQIAESAIMKPKCGAIISFFVEIKSFVFRDFSL